MNTFTDAIPAAAPDGFQQILDETRQRFVVSFLGQCDAIRLLVDKVADAGASGPVAALAEVTHRLSGLAGTIGFPTISARASELEHFVVDHPESAAFDGARARQRVDAIEAAFAIDLAAAALRPVPAIASAATVSAAKVSAGAADPLKVLIVEDDPDQRAIMEAWLREAGYSPVGVVAGDTVLAAVRAEQPALILLDVELPEVDGFDVCRQLKADPALADIPLIFLTRRDGVEDKLAGLTLGADEFLSKPVDLRELALRIGLLLKRTHAVRPRAVEGPLPFAAATPNPPAPRRTGPVVVVADDDPDIGRVIDAQLRHAGYTTVLATDGEHALAAIRAHTPDVLVLDLMMPRVSGFDVLEKLQQGGGPSPRIMVLSGRGREQDVVRAFALGADDYMTKPFAPHEMTARVARLMPHPAVVAA